MTIDWKNAPSGATHWHDAISTWYKIADDSVFYSNYRDVWVLSAYEISDINLSQGFIPRPTSTAIPELKKLTQAVFDGLPPEYRWAAVDADERACAYTDDPEHDEEIGIFGYFNCTDRAGADYIEIGYGYDATDWQDSKIERVLICDAETLEPLADQAAAEAEMRELMAAQAELSALRTQAIADAARIAELEASLAARGEALDFMKGAQQEWYEMYMQKRDAISRFKAGLVRAGARVPIDAMTMNANEQGLTATLVYLESELDRAAKRKYDLASIVSRGEQDDEN